MSAKRITIDARLFDQMRMALMFADKVLNEKYYRFAALDQNPFGIRDLVGSAARAADRVTFTEEK